MPWKAGVLLPFTSQMSVLCHLNNLLFLETFLKVLNWNLLKQITAPKILQAEYQIRGHWPY